MANGCTTEICQTFISMMSEGKTQAEVCNYLGIDHSTIENWRNPSSPHYESEFATALRKARVASSAWWDKKGRCNLKDPKFNTTLYALFRANMHGWRSGANNKADELDERAARIEKALGIADE